MVGVGIIGVVVALLSAVRLRRALRLARSGRLPPARVIRWLSASSIIGWSDLIALSVCLAVLGFTLR